MASVGRRREAQGGGGGVLEGGVGGVLEGGVGGTEGVVLFVFLEVVYTTSKMLSWNG
jgi:hypothetical protein